MAQAPQADIVSSKVTLGVEGGLKFPLWVARPNRAGRHPAVIVVMEAFGWNDHIKDVAGLFAREGYVAVAPDLYYRQGEGHIAAYTDIPEAIRLMNTQSDEDVLKDLERVMAYLAAQSFTRPMAYGIVGFCSGGRATYMAACSFTEIKAAVPFYGGGVTRREGVAIPVIDRTSAMQCPMLGIFGEEDEGVTAQLPEIEAEMKKHGKDWQHHVYPGAPHGVFCNERESYREEAATDAWRRTLDFFEQHVRAS